MSAVATALRMFGYIWLGLVVAFGVWQLNAHHLIFETGYGDVYLLLLLAVPGLAVVALANQMDEMKK